MPYSWKSWGQPTNLYQTKAHQIYDYSSKLINFQNNFNIQRRRSKEGEEGGWWGWQKCLVATGMHAFLPLRRRQCRAQRGGWGRLQVMDGLFTYSPPHPPLTLSPNPNNPPSLSTCSCMAKKALAEPVICVSNDMLMDYSPIQPSPPVSPQP